jgi:hypothetical protein
MSERESVELCFGSEGHPFPQSASDPSSLLGPGKGTCQGCGEVFSVDRSGMIPRHSTRFPWAFFDHYDYFRSDEGGEHQTFERGLVRIEFEQPVEMEPGVPYRIQVTGTAEKASYVEVVRDRDHGLREHDHVTEENEARALCDQRHWVKSVDADVGPRL